MSLKSGKSERAEELRGIVNSGHTPTNAFVIRAEKVGDTHVPKKFSTWTPMAMAGIRGMPRTWQDRSIEIPMKRKPKGWKVEKLSPRRNRKAFEQAKELSRKIARWADDHREALAKALPKLPDIDDRAQDNWELLLAVAEECGGEWPGRARKAAIGLSAGRSEPAGEGEQLLVDIHRIFRVENVDRISSADLCAALATQGLGQWKEYGRQQKPITQMQVANLLKPFGIGPGTIRLSSDGTAKGYKFEQFEEAFASYPEPDETSPDLARDQRSADSTRQDVTTAGGVGKSDDFPSVTNPPCDASKNSSPPNGEKECDDLTGRNSGSKGESIKTASDDCSDRAETDPHRNGTDPSARVHAFMTAGMQACLRDMGYAAEAIFRMSPQQGDAILSARLREMGHSDDAISRMTPEKMYETIRRDALKF